MRVRISVIGDLDLEKDIEAIESELAEEIPIQVRRIVDESTPSGKLYRRGPITARRTASGIKAGLRARRKTRMVIGNKIHRASKAGQPPAKDSGKLYREIKAQKVGRGRYRVSFGAGYIYYLDIIFAGQPDGGGYLQRSVLGPAIEAAAQKIFNQ